MSEEVVIAFGFDDGYAPHAAATIASIVANAPDARLHFLVIHDGIPAARRRLLESVAGQARFTWLEVETASLPDYVERAYTKHINRATLFRLQLDRLAPDDIRRVLYLDIDLVVLGDVREIWKTDLAGRPIGAVYDPQVSVEEFAQTYQLERGTIGYFNAGVLLIELDRVRAEGGFQSAVEFLTTASPKLADQDALNWRFWERWRPIDLRWNVQAPTTISARRGNATPDWAVAAGSPAIVHYTGGDKPWVAKGYHPWAWLYWRYLWSTPFLAEVMRRYEFGLSDLARVWLRYQRWRPRGPRSAARASP